MSEFKFIGSIKNQDFSNRYADIEGGCTSLVDCDFTNSIIDNDSFKNGSRLDFINCNFTGANIAWLSMFRFINCKFDSTYFGGNIPGPHFRAIINLPFASDFRNCLFTNCEFDGKEFFDSQFYECRFIESKLTKTRFTKNSLNKVTFERCNLEGVRFEENELNNTMFSSFMKDTRINSCQFFDSQFLNCNMEKTTIQNSEFHRCFMARNITTNSKVTSCDFDVCRVNQDESLFSDCKFRGEGNYSMF